MDELASAAKVTQVITCVSGIVGEGQHTLYGVAIDTIDTIKGIGKHRIAMCLGNVKANETESGNNKVV